MSARPATRQAWRFQSTGDRSKLIPWPRVETANRREPSGLSAADANVFGASLIGDGPTVLRQVTAVGNDLKLDQGIGICGKDGQSIPVSVGLPTIKIREIAVGGTEK